MSMSILKVGQLAPDFKATAYVNGKFEEISLKSYQDKWVCLFFYPLDFTVVCPTVLLEFEKQKAAFEKKNCYLVGCSTDSEHSHKRWFESKDFEAARISYPVLADQDHKVSKDYGVLVNEKIALRGTFLIDPKGILQWLSIHNLNVGQSVVEAYRTLVACQTGELCPVNWKEGEATLKLH